MVVLITKRKGYVEE